MNGEFFLSFQLSMKCRQFPGGDGGLEQPGTAWERTQLYCKRTMQSLPCGPVTRIFPPSLPGCFTRYQMTGGAQSMGKTRDCSQHLPPRPAPIDSSSSTPPPQSKHQPTSPIQTPLKKYSVRMCGIKGLTVSREEGVQ